MQFQPRPGSGVRSAVHSEICCGDVCRFWAGDKGDQRGDFIHGPVARPYLGAVMSLIASTGGVALLPVYAKSFLPDWVTTRPLDSIGPRIDLSLAIARQIRR